MKLGALLDIKELVQLAHDHFVGCQRHPTLPLRIYNYTSHAQFENKWGGTIDFCRGLIVDDNDNIVARPFKKFHNLQTSNLPETWEENLPQFFPMVTKKYDGSLGVYWKYDGHQGIATRGSFTSPQSQWATEWFNRACPDGFVDCVTTPATPLFEIIYPENRIVVKYDFEGLVLIGLVDICTGWEYHYPTLVDCGRYNGIRVTEEYNLSLAALKAANIENEEGYVLTYRNGTGSPLKIKVKMADYLRLHKIVTGMNARSVWELLSNGTGTGGFEHTPEHFKKWLTSWSEKLNGDFNCLYIEARKIFMNRPDPWLNGTDREYRAQFAQYIKRISDPNLLGTLFAMLDGHDPAPIIWRQIKPRGDDMTFRTEGE
jgi:RNA ligase